MDELKTLIDKASKVCGSDSQLAIRLGVAQSVISDMRHRGRTITPETAAELADIAGLDARQAAILAIIERARGTRREGALREILGKGLAAGVAAMLVFSYTTDSNSSTAEPKDATRKVNSLYIVECLKRYFAQLFQPAHSALRATFFIAFSVSRPC